jgi:hypothetical protein
MPTIEKSVSACFALKAAKRMAATRSLAYSTGDSYLQAKRILKHTNKKRGAIRNGRERWKASAIALSDIVATR